VVVFPLPAFQSWAMGTHAASFVSHFLKYITTGEKKQRPLKCCVRGTKTKEKRKREEKRRKEKETKTGIGK